MALRLKELAEHDYQFCITPTGRELPPMVEHWKRIECLLGQSLVKVPGPSMMDLILKYKALPSWRMRWCTRQIKIEPFIEYARTNSPAICYVGIRADESDDREGTNWQGIDSVTQSTPMVGWGWGINRVRQYLTEKGVVIPERSDCDFCFFQQLAEWWRLWRDWPDKWQEGEALEEFTGHTFRSDNRDTWPASMKGLRQMFESGYIPKGAAQTNLPFEISERSTMCSWCAR